MRLVLAAVYLVLMGLYFYAWNEDVAADPPLDWALLAGLAALQLGVGAGVGAWWAVALPFAAILVAVPYGYGEGAGQEAPIWFYYAFIMSLPAAILAAIGVGGRRLAVRRR
jgi:hypothetical protein